MDEVNDLKRLVRAIVAVRPRLADAVGDDWPLVQHQLDTLLAQVRDGSISEPALALRLRTLIARYPAVHDLVYEVLRAPVQPPFEDALREAPTGPATRAAEMVKPRYVNLAFLRAAEFSRVSRGEPLEPARDYLLRVDIGDLSAESMVSNAPDHAFPAERLPPTTYGHWLEVGVTSADFSVPDRTFPVFLPRRGPSWVCPCEPNGSHHCRPGQRDRFFHIEMRTPDVARSAQARLSIWFHTSLLQSLLIVADVASAGQHGEHAATVDYTLTADLTDLDEIEPRGLSVLTNQRPDGTHTLVFKGGSGEIAFTMAEEVITGAMGSVRNCCSTRMSRARAEGAATSLTRATENAQKTSGPTSSGWPARAVSSG